jgi:hypothetical protein
MALLNLDFTPGAINDLNSIELPDNVVIPEYTSTLQSEPEIEPEPETETDLEANHPHAEWRANMRAKGYELTDLNNPIKYTLVENPFEQAKSKWRDATTRRKQIVAELDYEVLQARKEMDSYR